MTRQLALIGSAVCLVLSTGVASAVDLPIRKAGLWEMKMLRTGGPMPEITMQHCTDETTDKEMSAAASPMAKEVCSKQDIQKTATGDVSDTTMTIEAKWLGACKSDQKPGDIIMPGGMKMNVKDMEKLKGLLPKQK